MGYRETNSISDPIPSNLTSFGCEIQRRSDLVILQKRTVCSGMEEYIRGTTKKGEEKQTDM